MLKNCFLIASLLLAGQSVYAREYSSVNDTARTVQPTENNIRYVKFKRNFHYQPLRNETFPEQTSAMSPITKNRSKENDWFVSASTGVSVFAGSPLGCEDIFGRVRPDFQLSAGKWIIPNVGIRIGYQGFDLKNHLIERQQYHHLHGDLLWNVTNHFWKHESTPLWHFIPYIGSGIINNRQSGKHPFTVDYGFLNEFRLSKNLYLTMELGGLTTFADFDGAGKASKLGDHLFHVSAGITFRFGANRWDHSASRHTIFSASQYDYLQRDNHRLQTVNEQQKRTIAQMYHVLETEGLLKKRQQGTTRETIHAETENRVADSLYILYPVNDYSGLNSLRNRLAQQAHGVTDAGEDTYAPQEDPYNSKQAHSGEQATGSITGNPADNPMPETKCIGTSILFFFRLNTAELTEPLQLANLDEIARISKQYGLRLKVTGYADDATGSETLNQTLSERRAQRIVSLLEERGIDAKKIVSKGEGGTDIYTPKEANRCAIVELKK